MAHHLPDFLILGPPKTASTSLHYYLSQHPDIYMSDIKETRYLDLQYKEDLEGYSDFFKNASEHVQLGEATPTYSFLPFVADRIKKHFPNIKLVFCFRDPVERAYAGWLMRQAKGNEKLSFAEALKVNAEDYHTFQGEQGVAEWLEDQGNLDNNNKILFRTYLQGSMYAQQLKYYLQLFHISQIQIIWMDELQKEPGKVLADLFSFLSVDPDFKDIDLKTVNKYRKIRVKFLFNLLGKGRAKSLKNLVPPFVFKLLKPALRADTTRPDFTQTDKSEAWKYFQQDVEELEKLTGKDLSGWKNKYPTLG